MSEPQPGSDVPARPIARLLVANRGEVAARIFRTARAMGITCVAVHSDPDAKAPFVADADLAVRLPGATAAETYLRADRLVAAALAAGADAVHPGYGFLAESAAFATACREAGLTFVGPPPQVIAVMGSKLAAKERMAAAGVAVLPSGRVPARGAPAAALAAEADRIGWPLLVKADAGGGGRGMRLVGGAEELAEAVASAQREAEAAFGDGTVFLEPYLERARHLEVQILADAHGGVAHLFERECSVQRRHQKLVEECPAPGVDAGLRAELCRLAVTAARAIGYVGAGTVELLLAPDGRVRFLEMNTRLQVEHAVTESVTGLDLVRLQLLVAEGHRLPAEVRAATIEGHAIEARLYAEDATAGWAPSTGTLLRFRVPELPGVRVDAGVCDGTEVSPYYDPLLAKVIAHAPTRAEAARLLAAALARAQIHGLVTNRDLLVQIVRHPEFMAGAADTGFLDRHPPAELGAALAGPDVERLHAAAAALAAQAQRRRSARTWRPAPSGWRNNPSQLQQAAYRGRQGRIDIGYRLDRRGTRLTAQGEELVGVTVAGCDPDGVDLVVGSVRRRLAVHRAAGRTFVDGPDGSSTLLDLERLPEAEPPAAPWGALAAPMPGAVCRVLVATGDEVAAGQPLVILEAMKMEHTVRAPGAGRVAELRVGEGDQVEAGEVLAVLAELEASGDDR